MWRLCLNNNEATFVENTNLQEDLEDLMMKYGLQVMSCSYVNRDGEVQVTNFGEESYQKRLSQFVIKYYGERFGK